MSRVRTAVSVLTISVAAASANPAAAALEQGAGSSRRQRVERVVTIYAAVIRQLVTIDHTFGQADPGFGVVYVINGPVERADDPSRPIGEVKAHRPFGSRVVKGLRAALDDLPDVTFVEDRSAVVAGEAPGHVINDGVLLTLGPIRGGATRVEVGNSLWISGLAGQWLTYVLERKSGTWEVAGTTGPVAIS